MSKLSGKALGIAVAKEVMGWRQEGFVWFYDYDGPVPVFTANHITHHDYLVVWDREGTILVQRQWAPWRDLNDTWEVVERMATLYRMGGDSQGKWALFSVREGRAVIDYYATAETAPEAILRAALKAKGGEE